MNTCGGCPATWTSRLFCHCAAAGCHQTFSGVGGFDLHRRGGSCADPASIVSDKTGKPLLRLDDRGIWVGAEARPKFWERSEETK